MEREEILNKLETDITKLDKKCRYYVLDLIKNKCVKNLKISYRALKLAAPYILVIGLIGGTFSVFPDSKSIKKVYSVNTNGKKYFSTDFNNKNSYDGIVKVYGNYQKNDDGTYKRDIYLYDFANFDPQYIDIAFDNDSLDFSKLFGKPISSSCEVTSYIAYKDPAHIEVLLTNDDELWIFENPIAFLIYLLTMIMQVPPIVKDECSVSGFYDYVVMTREKYKKEDLAVLKRKLEIRKANYEMLSGDDDE